MPHSHRTGASSKVITSKFQEGRWRDKRQKACANFVCFLKKKSICFFTEAPAGVTLPSHLLDLFHMGTPSFTGGILLPYIALYWGSVVSDKQNHSYKVIMSATIRVLAVTISGKTHIFFSSEQRPYRMVLTYCFVTWYAPIKVIE